MTGRTEYDSKVTWQQGQVHRNRIIVTGQPGQVGLDKSAWTEQRGQDDHEWQQEQDSAIDNILKT